MARRRLFLDRRPPVPHHAGVSSRPAASTKRDSPRSPIPSKQDYRRWVTGEWTTRAARGTARPEPPPGPAAPWWYTATAAEFEPMVAGLSHEEQQRLMAEIKSLQAFVNAERQIGGRPKAVRAGLVKGQANASSKRRILSLALGKGDAAYRRLEWAQKRRERVAVLCTARAEVEKGELGPGLIRLIDLLTGIWEEDISRGNGSQEATPEVPLTKGTP